MYYRINNNKTLENYLKTMLLIEQETGYVRSVDVARYLGITKPGVTYFTKRLKEKGYISMNKDHFIILTEIDTEIARNTIKRQKILKEYLILIGVPEDIAEKDSCKIEHSISTESFEALYAFLDRQKNY